MLRVRIEYVPWMGMTPVETIGEIAIANNGTHGDRPAMGNYSFRLVRGDRERECLATVEDFPREQRDAFDLLLCVLLKAVGDRNEAEVAAAFRRVAERTPGFLQRLADDAAGIERKRVAVNATRDQAMAGLRRFRPMVEALADGSGPIPARLEPVVRALACFVAGEICRSEAEVRLAEGDDPAGEGPA